MAKEGFNSETGILHIHIHQAPLGQRPWPSDADVDRAIKARQKLKSGKLAASLRFRGKGFVVDGSERLGRGQHVPEGGGFAEPIDAIDFHIKK